MSLRLSVANDVTLSETQQRLQLTSSTYLTPSLTPPQADPIPFPTRIQRPKPSTSNPARMHFPWSKPTRTERPRETFTYRQRQTSTATSSSRRSRKTRTARPTPAVVCPANDYIPHHRNLGLAPWATSAEIRAAWRALSLRLHPDKSRDPAAARAMAVVNTSYEELRRGREGAVYRWVENWLLDGEVDSSERARRRAEAGACRAVVRRKPWVRDYREWEERGGGREGEVVFNEAFWVNGVHRVVDSTMPRLWTDWMWDLDRGWRVDGRNGTENGDGLERLEFYGECASPSLLMRGRRLMSASLSSRLVLLRVHSDASKSQRQPCRQEMEPLRRH